MLASSPSGPSTTGCWLPAVACSARRRSSSFRGSSFRLPFLCSARRRSIDCRPRPLPQLPRRQRQASARCSIDCRPRPLPLLAAAPLIALPPGESLEEAVRRETWEETGIEVGEVVYHSSQPWPVGPSSMPCQLMVGFFAYAKSRDINVDKEELEDARWHSRDDVKKALAFAEYKKAQRSASAKVVHMCRGLEKGQSLSTDFNIESGELAPMFFPGPYAIAHHLISSWANPDSIVNGVQTQLKFPGSSLSNL